MSDANAAKSLNLWSGKLPGSCREDQLDHPAAKEIPNLVPFLLPADGTARPLVVVCPGGGYGCRAAHEGTPIAEWLNEIGLHAVVCNYRVYPWLYPTPLMDAQRAVRLARAHAAGWGVDPSRIGVLGFSAGGHLACSVANFGDDGEACAADPVARCASRVQALISCYAVVSSGPRGHAGSFRNLLGENPAPERLQKLSLEASVTPANPPSFIWHTFNDGAVPVANALLYAQALDAAKVPFALHVYPDGRHGLGLAREALGTASGWTKECGAWLRERGWIG